MPRRATVILDERLVAKCQVATGIQSIHALIDYALHELLRHDDPKKIPELQGTVHWEGNLGKWRRAWV